MTTTTDMMNHAEYPKTLRSKTVESLRWIIKDCQEAITAMPNGYKVGYYADEIHYCSMELYRRHRDPNSNFRFA